MKKLCNTEAELKKLLQIKKAPVSKFDQNIVTTQNLFDII